MSKSSACNKGKALHISQWIKGELGGTAAGGGGGVACAMDWGGGYRGGGGHDNRDDAEFELWSQERMDAKNTEIRRRLEANARDTCRGNVATVVCGDAETVSAHSSPDDSQVIACQYNVHRQYTVGGRCKKKKNY